MSKPFPPWPSKLDLYRTAAMKRIISDMEQRIEFSPGDLVEQVGGTQFHPRWRRQKIDQENDYWVHSLRGHLLYLGVHERLIDANYRQAPNGPCWVFLHLESKREFYFHDYPGYLRDSCFLLITPGS